MRSLASRVGVLVVSAAVALRGACNSGDEESGDGASSPGREVPLPEDLVEALLDEEDLGDPWVVFTPAFAEFPGGQPGVIPYDSMPQDIQEIFVGVQVPGWAPCPDGAPRLLEPAWQVMTMLAAPGLETEGGQLPTLEEKVFADDASEVTRIFTEIRDSLAGCVGEAREDHDDGYTVGTVETVDPPAVGDAGFTLRIREAGVAAPGDANLSEGWLVLVQAGDVLALITVVDVGFEGE